MQNPQLTTLLRKRLHAFQALAQAIAEGQQACIALDFDGVRAHDDRKQSVCAGIEVIEQEIAALRRDPVNGDLLRRLAGPVESSPSRDQGLAALRRLWSDSETARAEAGERNRVYAEFLRRAQSTGRLMMNVIAHCLGVYPSEAFPGQSQFERSL